MKKFLGLVVALSFLLTACFPPNFVVVDPDPISPDPIEVVDIFVGSWEGTIAFSSTDGFGNVENQIVGISTDVTQTNFIVDGSIVFETALVEECSLSGEQELLTVTFVVLCEDIVGFEFVGELEDGRLVGSYDVTSTALTLQDGVFSLSFVGGLNE